MGFVKALTRTAGLGLCAVAFTGSALADPGNGNGNGNGHGGTPPGQEQKAEQAAPAPAPAATSAPAPQQAAPGQAKKAEKTAEKAAVKADRKPEDTTATKAEHERAAKVESKGAAKSEQKKSEQQASQSKGRSAEAHHHVIICHRTGSESNPYVVINIPWTAWSEAHSPDTGAHPDLNGRHDIMLKDPASRPGSKDGFDKGDCEAAAGLPAVQTPAQTDVCPNLDGMQTEIPAGMVKDASGICVHKSTQAQVDVCPNIAGMQAEVPGGMVKDASGMCVVTATPASSVTAPGRKAGATKAPAGEVVKTSAPAAASTEQPTSGVLGAVASAPDSIAQTATSGTLPFTGIPLWIAALLGGGLLAAGFALRRAAQH